MKQYFVATTKVDTADNRIYPVDTLAEFDDGREAVKFAAQYEYDNKVEGVEVFQNDMQCDLNAPNCITGVYDYDCSFHRIDSDYDTCARFSIYGGYLTIEQKHTNPYDGCELSDLVEIPLDKLPGLIKMLNQCGVKTEG